MKQTSVTQGLQEAPYMFIYLIFRYFSSLTIWRGTDVSLGSEVLIFGKLETSPQNDEDVYDMGKKEKVKGESHA